MSTRNGQGARDLWVICAGAERSGSTLQYQIAAELVERAELGVRLGFVKPDEFDGFVAQHDETPGIKVVKAHRPSHPMLRALEVGDAVAIHAHRDVRAALVSWMRFRGQGIDQLERFVHQYLNGVAQWEAAKGRILYSQYEIFVGQPADEVRRVAAFLDIDVSKTASVAIARELSARKQRRVAEALTPEDLDDLGRHDRKTLLHQNHFSPKGSAEWHEVLATDDIARVERLAGAWLEDHGYKLTGVRP